MHPDHVTHVAAAGGNNEYRVDQVSVVSIALDPCPFSMPPPQMLPEDTTWDAALPEAPCWWTNSGHLLLRPTIDGQQIGYMLLDTGQPAIRL